MSDDRKIDTPASADRPTFKVFSDGNEVDKTYQFKALSINRAVNQITEATILILDGAPSKEDFPISNSADFIPGKEIEITAGYHSDEESIFKGIVVCHSIKVYEHQSAVLRIDCKDAAVKMSVGRKNKYFYESTDSEILEEIIKAIGLNADVETTTLQHQEMVQFHATDWDFLVTRAEVNGMCVYTEDGTVKIAPPDLSQEANLKLRYGGNLIDFEARMDARHQFSAINAYSWNATNQEMIEIEAAALSGSLLGDISPEDLAEVIGLNHQDLRHAGQLKDGELQAWSNALMLKSRLAKVQARARIQGLGSVRPGQIVELGGVGNRFNGKAFVAGVRHEINEKNWETNIEFGLSPKWFSQCQQDVNMPTASGILPAVSGLQIGLVTALEDDPQGAGRVKVRIPMIDATEEGVWARVATLDAGENRGTFFMPELQDEVILGFLNDDPRNPIIMGMVNSSAKPAAFTPTDENPEKGFVTRSGMKLVFDDEKIMLTIETPNGNIFQVNDDAGSIDLEDENGNKITMNSDGITIKSAADFQLKAAGDVTIEGTNITQSASAKFKAEGSTGAEVSTGATAVLKGSMVQIN